MGRVSELSSLTSLALTNREFAKPKRVMKMRMQGTAVLKIIIIVILALDDTNKKIDAKGAIKRMMISILTILCHQDVDSIFFH